VAGRSWGVIVGSVVAVGADVSVGSAGGSSVGSSVSVGRGADVSLGGEVVAGTTGVTVGGVVGDTGAAEKQAETIVAVTTRIKETSKQRLFGITLPPFQLV